MILNQANTYHILIIYESSQTREILLDRLTYSIGRDIQNAIAIENRGISRQHALLFRRPTAKPGEYIYRLVDGNSDGQRSRNGFTVNGVRTQERDLQSGDQIVFGSVISVEYKILTLSEGQKPPELNAQPLDYKSVKAPVVNTQKTLVNLSLLDFQEDGEESTQELITVARR